MKNNYNFSVKKNIQFVILGNCQNQEIANMFNMIINLENFVVKNFYHEMIKDNYEMLKREFELADIIIMQPLSEKFGYFSTDNIKNIYPSKCLVIPNLFFRGYFPELTYAGEEGKRLPSPIGEYHHAGIIAGWKMGIDENKLHNLLNSEKFYLETGLKDTLEKSINELRNREKTCDVIISDFILQNYKHIPLFYTVNHPTGALIYELVIRILNKLEIEKREIPDYLFRTSLVNAAIFGMNPTYSNMVNIKFKQSIFVQPNRLGGKGYDLLTYIKESYRVYQNINLIEIRIPEEKKILTYMSEQD